MCLNSSRLLKSLWTPGIGIQNHLSGQLPWIRSWRNCDGAGKPSKTSSRDAPCRVHEKGGKNNSSRLGDTTLVVLGYDLVMAKSDSPFEITCPCCSAVLKVDPEIKEVIAHTAAVKPRMFADMEEAARAMKEQDSRRDSIFRQSVEAQKHASDLLEKKFQEAVRKAKETPDTGRPIRDFDLD